MTSHNALPGRPAVWGKDATGQPSTRARLARNAAGLGLGETALAAVLTKSQLAHVESGVRSLTRDEAERLASALGVRAEELTR